MTSTRETLQSVVARLAEVIDQLPADPPEVPETVTEWPENDEHLRGDCWKSPWGSILLHRDGKWRWWNSWDRTWPLQATPGLWTPLERIADPTEVPDRIEQWPREDEHLRGEVWEDADGDIYRFSDGQWEVWSPRMREWVGAIDWLNSNWAPFTRTTDPSAPRTWDTLYDVPEDVERVSGDYGGHCRELTRSGLSESGWFQRAKGGSFRGWMELPTDQTKHVKNIREEQ